MKTKAELMLSILDHIIEACNELKDDALKKGQLSYAAGVIDAIDLINVAKMVTASRAEVLDA